MKKLFTVLKRAPKRTTAAVAILAGVIFVPAALFAWGPGRPTFTMDHPAPYVTFNSITNNPAQGDERDFVQIKDSAASNSTYSDKTALQPGHTYDVYVYYHNDASSTLNDAAHNYEGIARNAYMKVEMPSTVSAGQPAAFQATVGASNAKPTSVWSNATGTAAGTYALSYVPNSAVVHSNGAVNGSKMPDSLYTTGAPLGYDKLDGNLPGCLQYSGYVIYQVKVNQPNFTVNKTVRIDGQGSYQKQIAANPGQTLDYEIEYNNTGTTTQNDVVIQDKLPKGVTYVPGSTQLANPNTGGKWVNQTSNDVVTNGVSIGDYGPSSNAYVKFKAKVAGNTSLPTCGTNTLVNTATAKTDNGDKSSTATVTVTKTCTPPPQEVQVCRLSDHKVVTINKKDYDSSKYSTDLTKCTPVTPPVTPPSTPTTPVELPHTGASNVILSLFGAGSLIAAVSYYVASRKALS